MKKRTVILFITLCVYSITQCMRERKDLAEKTIQPFKITINAETGSVKSTEKIKTRPNSVEIKLGYNFLFPDPDNDPSYNIGIYAKPIKPSNPQDEVQLSQEDT